MTEQEKIAAEVWNYLAIDTAEGFVAWMQQLHDVAKNGGDLNCGFSGGAAMIPDGGYECVQGRMARVVGYNQKDA